MKIAIIDYGMGNIYSVKSALKFHGVDWIYTSKEESILEADKIILPGVGSFGLAMKNIRSLDLERILKKAVLEMNIPILGICLGMQLLGESSTEDGFTKGLGLFNGKVTKFIFADESLKIPHVGYNSVSFSYTSKLFKGIEENADFYFVHSYRMLSETDVGVGYCTYGDNFVAFFEKKNVFGTQFHPEKSQTNGLLLIRNFLSW